MTFDALAALCSYTGKPATAFIGLGALARISQDGAGNLSVSHWDPSLGAQPTIAQIVAAAATPSAAQLLAYASQKQNATLAQVFIFNVAAAGASPLDVTTTLDASGSAAMLKIGMWAQLNAAASPSPALAYSNVDYTQATLTVAEAASLAAQAGALEAQTYALLNQAAAAILATPPTIATTAQIDALAWPVAGTPGA